MMGFENIWQWIIITTKIYKWSISNKTDSITITHHVWFLPGRGWINDSSLVSFSEGVGGEGILSLIQAKGVDEGGEVTWTWQILIEPLSSLNSIDQEIICISNFIHNIPLVDVIHKNIYCNEQRKHHGWMIAYSLILGEHNAHALSPTVYCWLPVHSTPLNL